MSTAAQSAELGGGFFNPKRRRLGISLIIAIVIEAGLAIWLASAIVHNVTTESQPPQIPVQVHIVKPPPIKKPPPKKPPPKVIPKIATPIPTHQIMPNIKPPPVMPQLAAQANAMVLPPPIDHRVGPPPDNSAYVTQQFNDSVIAAVQSEKQYPREALLAGHTGKIKVSFVYTDGHASNIKILDPASDDSLNMEVRKMIMQAHLPPPPPNLAGQPLIITFYVTFIIP